jgi:hypothetical protein
LESSLFDIPLVDDAPVLDPDDAIGEFDDSTVVRH